MVGVGNLSTKKSKRRSKKKGEAKKRRSKKKYTKNTKTKDNSLGKFPHTLDCSEMGMDYRSRSQTASFD